MTTARVTVPVEPTEAQLSAAADAFPRSHPSVFPLIYRAMLSAAPAPEGGAADGWRPIDSAPIGELVQVYWPCMALNDDGELTGEMLDREGHVSLSIRHSEKHGWEPDNAIEANGDWFGDDFEFGEPTHWKPRPSRPGAALASREEAPAGAGPVCLEIPLSNSMRVTLEYGPDGSRTATLWNEANEPIADGDAPSLRAQPPAREDAQPVARVSPDDMAQMTCFANNHGTVEDWHVWCRIRSTLTTHPAPDALREAREAVLSIKDAADSFRDCSGDEIAGQVIIRCDQALAALQAEQKGGA